MDSKKSCRFCGDFPEDFVDIFQDFEDLTIAAILSQHIGVQIYKDDGSSHCLCQACWTNTKKFHIFYKKMENLQKKHLKSNNFVEQHSFNSHENQTAHNSSYNVIKLEPNLSILDEVEETNAYIVKTEEINPAISFDPFRLIERETSVDASYNPSEFADSKDDQSSEDEEPSPKVKGKSQNNGIPESKNSILDNADDSSHQHSKTRTRTRSKNCLVTSKKDPASEDAQIREFCNMKCEICCDQLETFAEAEKHYRIFHDTNGYLTCCRKKFFRRKGALEHIQCHLNPERFECDICGFRVINKYYLQRHMQNHLPRVFKCDMCTSSFPLQWKLRTHKRRQHCSEEDKKFHCGQCNKKFVLKSILDEHIRCVHNFAHARVCDICAKVCKTSTSFRRHMKTHSTVVQPKVQCNVCGLYIKNEDGLQKHLKGHQDTPSLNCPICNRVLKCKLSLTSHMHIVHGERSHQCTMCDKAFTTAYYLKEHMAMHTGKLQYTCRYCTHQFTTKSNQRYHQKKVHFDEWTIDRSKRYAPNC